MEQYSDKLERLTKLRIIGKYTLSSKKHKLQCLICNNIFEATPKSKVRNFNLHGKVGCPLCTMRDRYKDVVNNNISKLGEKFTIITDLTVNEFNNDLMLEVKNKQCGHIFITKTGNLLNRDVICPVCNTEHKSKRMQQYSETQRTNSLIGKEGFDLYKSEARALSNQSYLNNIKTINPDNLKRGRSGTDGAYHLDHTISIKYCFMNNIPIEICCHPDNLRMIPWKENAVKWKRPTRSFPKIFWKHIDHYKEKLKFIEFIKSNIPILCDTYKECDDDYALDLFSSELNVGIMFHRFDDIVQGAIGTRYHLRNISDYYNSVGIRVIHIYEDEWLNKRQMVIDKIGHIVNCGNVRRQKVYGRKCIIKTITDKSGLEFLKSNHIQGGDNAQVTYGAYYGDELLAVMTFCKPRVFMRGNEFNEIKWELSRFATHSDYIVVGIASKLLKHFKRINKWDNIYSFADLRWSSRDSNVYNILGFDKTSKPSVGYYYIVDGIRKHRWKYQKNNIKKLFPNQYNPKLTEYQNMLNIGYDRVWNCGIMKYEMQNI